MRGRGTSGNDTPRTVPWHDERSQTVAALETVLAELTARGYAFALLCA